MEGIVTVLILLVAAFAPRSAATGGSPVPRQAASAIELFHALGQSDELSESRLGLVRTEPAVADDSEAGARVEEDFSSLAVGHSAQTPADEAGGESLLEVGAETTESHPVRGSAREEKRADPTDPEGPKFTRQEFLDYYGDEEGAQKWTQAGGTEVVEQRTDGLAEETADAIASNATPVSTTTAKPIMKANKNGFAKGKDAGSAQTCREFFINAKLEDYRGCQDHTVTGSKCLPWSQFTNVVAAQNVGEGALDYCRNPGGQYPKGIWCFTSASAESEYCDVRADKECDELLHGEKGTLYRGCQDHTISGRKCQSWQAHEPHAHIYNGSAYYGSGVSTGNYCRNPGGTQATIWCYTVDPEVRWEVCTPKAYAADVTSTLPIAFNPVIMQEGAKAWTDRSDYLFNNVPTEMVGATLFQGPHDITSPGVVTVKANHLGAIVYAFSEDRAVVNKRTRTCEYPRTLIPSAGWLEAGFSDFFYNANERRFFKVWRYDLAPRTSITWITGSAGGCVGGFVVKEVNPQGLRGRVGNQGPPGPMGAIGPDGPPGPKQQTELDPEGLCRWNTFYGCCVTSAVAWVLSWWLIQSTILQKKELAKLRASRG